MQLGIGPLTLLEPYGREEDTNRFSDFRQRLFEEGSHPSKDLASGVPPGKIPQISRCLESALRWPARNPRLCLIKATLRQLVEDLASQGLADNANCSTSLI